MSKPDKKDAEKTAFINKILESIHPPSTWAYYTEMRIGTGYGKDAEQRFDGWAINYFPSKQNVVRCYEVKVSRGDFLKELHTPVKRRAGLLRSNEFYFVAPEGLIKVDEVPLECGLKEVNMETGEVTTPVPAPYRECVVPSWKFVASLTRREDAARNQDKLREQRLLMSAETIKQKILHMIKLHTYQWSIHYHGNDKDAAKKITNELQVLYGDILNMDATKEVLKSVIVEEFKEDEE